MASIPSQADREAAALARMMMISGSALAAHRVPAADRPARQHRP